MDPQEGDIADLPDGRTATYQGGRWVVQGGAQAQSGPAGIPNFVPFQSPADRRAEAAAARADAAAERAATNDERRLANENRTVDRQGVRDELALKNDFLGLPEVRLFPVVRTQYDIIKRMANDSSPVGDLALVTAYMKMLDPNSVVREQEFANAQNAGGAEDRARAWISSQTGNGILTPKQRADFVAQARGVYASQATIYNERVNEFRGLAEQYGYSPDNIGKPIEIDTAPISVNQEALSPDEARDPNVLSAQGYQYDGTTDTWHRNAESASNTEDYRRTITGPDRNAAGFMRGVVDTATFGFSDEIGAAIDTVLPSMGGQRSGWQDGFGQAYQQNVANYRSYAGADAQDVPLSRGAGQIAGGLVAPGAMAGGRMIAAAPTALGAAGRGAMVGGLAGGAYGAGSAEGPIEQRLEGAQDGAVTGAMAGGVLGGGGRVVGNAVGDAASRMMTGPRAQAVRTLDDNGVFMTPGQRMGGLVGNAEDLAQRAPILGPAIRGARQRSAESLNRAVGNRALAPINEGVPAGVDVGGDMVGHVRDRLGAEFDRAYSMVPQFVPDEQFGQSLARIGQAKADLPPAMQQQFDAIIGERLTRLGDAPTGQQVGSVRTELNGLASGYLRSQDPAQQGLGRMLAEISDELDGAVSRANPEAGQILSQAREGYSDYIRLERASTAAGGQPFSPGQLSSAVRTSDGSVRRGAVGRGEAQMQDLSGAAQQVLPGRFGNPGTADAVGLGGLGVGMVTEPVTTTAVAAGLGAAATPYMLMGRKVVERLPPNATREQLQAAAGELDQLAAQDSNVIVLKDEIARRIAQAVPAAAQQTVGERRLMTGPR